MNNTMKEIYEPAGYTWTEELKERVIVRLMRGLRRVESGWTQHAFARDRHGQTVMLDAQDACAWCSTGAILDTPMVDGSLQPDEISYRLSLMFLAMALPPAYQNNRGSVVMFNDDLTTKKVDVVQLFKRATLTAALRDTTSAEWGV